MTLAIDIGNTQIAVGLFRGEETVRCWRLHTDADRTADEYGVTLVTLLSSANYGAQDIARVVLCSVVPPLTQEVVQACEGLFALPVLRLEPDRQTVIPVRYESPSQVGADRVANAIAARKYYGTPAIVLDLGTATTFDAVSAAGEYLGGAILPGISTSLEALFHATSMLARVELRKPERAIGRNTAESLRAGAFYGFAGQVGAIVERFQSELGGGAKVIATGGLAWLVCEGLALIDAVDPHLTLRGLNAFADECEKQARV